MKLIRTSHSGVVKRIITKSQAQLAVGVIGKPLPDKTGRTVCLSPTVDLTMIRTSGAIPRRYALVGVPVAVKNFTV